ncbi:MAG TPA: glycerophosphodiester phosphodiesterase family protein [Allosphingosinicella sp.]|nr:glycerophosphodiester phosphodiesterase family protein [Allosphingosinicella sp.]
MRKSRLALALVAAAAVALSLTNASWIASRPTGPLTLVAHRGVAQPEDLAPADGCGARHMRVSGHAFIENTLFSMQNAVRFGARALMLDVRASADGQAMIFRDADLACRTDGSGRVADRPLAYLRRLDIGYGYTADNGRSFPLRGRGVGGMAVAEEVLRAFPSTILIFTLSEPGDAEALVAAFARAGVAIGDRHGFAGPPAALARLRRLTQAGWLLDREASEACLSGYRAWGWLGRVPASCRGTTVILPRRGEWTLWGWPYRFFARMTAVGARLFIGGDSRGTGLDRAEQLGEVPHDYRGLLLIEDMYAVGRALER